MKDKIINSIRIKKKLFVSLFQERGFITSLDSLLQALTDKEKKVLQLDFDKNDDFNCI